MSYSKKQITKAGKILLTSKSIEERNAALELINIWRSNHLHPLNVMKNSLLRLLNQNKIEPLIVSQRLKRLTSIEYKLDLNESMGLGGMQDIGGYRAVVKDTKDLFKLKRLLEKNTNNHTLKRTVDYVHSPKPSGYRSIHFIYDYNSKSEKYKGLQLELQIRTKLQHNWATAVETAGILTKTSLKSSQGPDEWLYFFKIVSSLFAIKEKLPVLQEHTKLSMEELMVECSNCTVKLNIIDILKALRISAKQIEIDKFNGDYYLININLLKKFVHITTFKKSDFESASEEYLNLEKTIKDNENAVVLVAASSIKSLKKAYPSYFLDTSEFISALERINDNCKRLNLTNSYK
ncbi:RelA/SpoT domain-containing protein [Pontibacter sp. BT731]|uniref:RelA/SpoT domain-containing protein n=1 Tax=Pontibacter coccineus TaxID=3063328 RepID=UPI0026E292C7|nr:RelA/SpoT domain-containing protein [Pontibacter sp. BT731]MDO6391183.1 RelA/SpoT domain-containing protein [Pontibacter sp. BT731]